MNCFSFPNGDYEQKVWRVPAHAFTCFCSDIAALTDENQDLLVPDEGCEYDQMIELNLDEVTSAYICI